MLSMRLSVAALEEIVKSVRICENSGLNVTQLSVAGHIVWLQSTDDEREGRSYVVIGITDKGSSHTPGYRGEVMK